VVDLSGPIQTIGAGLYPWTNALTMANIRNRMQSCLREQSACFGPTPRKNHVHSFIKVYGSWQFLWNSAPVSA